MINNLLRKLKMGRPYSQRGVSSIGEKPRSCGQKTAAAACGNSEITAFGLEWGCNTAARDENCREPPRLTMNVPPNGKSRLKVNPGFLPILLLLFALSARAATYYVSTTGSDASPGSLAKPWRTIQKAANTLTPGDTALVRSGTYNERVTVGVSGTTNQYITFSAYTGEYPRSSFNTM